uniref:Exportin-4 n=1 Tax=Setaria digitata TaxID=48799 RepID=A0A915PVU4_9BILA
MEEMANNQSGFDSSHVTQMEEAASILMLPNITQDARKAAEEFFINIRNEKFSPEYCRLVIEATSNEFVVFEMVQLMVMNLFKQWSILEPPIFRQCFSYLLENVAHRVSKLIRSEMLRACAKLLKRSIFDGKACDADTLDQTVHFLLTNEDPQLQAIACEFIEAIASEFATSWRTSNLGISFDFHLRARRSFENGGLQRLFEKCIHTFSELLLTADLSLPYCVSICENFLRVADLVLSWNFEIHRFPVRITFANEGAPAAALRPPESWKTIFHSDQFLRLFFELHKRVRHNEVLCIHSMNCLIQLSSLMGPVLTDDDSLVSQKLSPSSTSTFISAHDRYVSNFINGFVDIFGSGPLEGEILGLCMIVHKLLTYHRILSFPRAEMSFLTFVTIVVQCAEHLTPIAMQKALEEDDHVYIEGLQNLYDGWWVMLRNSDIIRNTSRYAVNFEDSTLTIISAFMRTVLSEPFGCRVKIPLQECDGESDDDREVFKDLLNAIGRFSAFYCTQMLPRMFTVIFDKMKQFLSFIETGVHDETLNVWREDMHWILLLVGFMLTSSDDDGSSHLQNDILDHFEHIVYGEIVDIDSSAPYIKACIDSPDSISDPARVDPLMKIVGAVLAWCSLEHKLLIDRGPEAVSPELARSALWCSGRLICALGFHVLNSEDSERLATVIRSISQTLVDFALQKSFGILNNLSGERKLCADAVEVLIGLVRAGCNEAAKSPFLFPCLSTVQIERLPARHSLLKVLVQIGAMMNDENIKKNLFVMILQPLRERFVLLSKDSASLETNLVDLMNCFGGIAEAAHNYNTHFLFDYLSPVLTCSISLLLSYKESQLITNAVLDLFNDVTRRMGVYSEDRNDMIFLYEALLELIRVYRDGQFTRYKVIDVDVEEKASDLIILLDILANVLSKDILSVIPSSSSDTAEFAKSGSRVALIALEMLLPVMEDDLLKLPSFYRFILYFTEMTPQSLESLPEVLFISIIECLRHGLNSNFGQEIALISAETVTEIASYFARHTPKNEAAIAHLSVLVEPTFVMCLTCCWQVDLQSSSATALFSLICCNQMAFEEYVKQLLSRNENLQYQAALQSAFQALLPANLKLHLGRREKRDFRDRFEQFLNQSQGSKEQKGLILREKGFATVWRVWTIAIYISERVKLPLDVLRQ